MRRTRLAIMGAGSIGCHLGGWLASSADVTLIGRAATIPARIQGRSPWSVSARCRNRGGV